MKITIFSQLPPSKFGGVKSMLPADVSFEILPIRGLKRALDKVDTSGIVYLDTREIGEAGIRKHASALSSCGPLAWGVLDPGGIVQDIAGLFFLGAKDYIGPSLARTPLSADRLRAVRSFAGIDPASCLDTNSVQRFPGWKKLEEGSEIVARFCYASLGDPEGLREKIGEKRLTKLREDYSGFMGSWAAECGGVAWMRDTEGTLLLFPEIDEGTNPILGAFRLLLDRALVGYEVFSLEVPLTFRFAFHSGKTVWRRPGATGTIVSGDVNFIFHLGSRFCSDGRITLSADMEALIPSTISDLFVPAGDFEGRRVLASRRFKD